MKDSFDLDVSNVFNFKYSHDLFIRLQISLNYNVGAGVTAYDSILGGTPQLGSGITPLMGTLIEAILTFILVFTVLMTAVDQGTPIAPIAIGFAVVVDILAGWVFSSPLSLLVYL